MKTENNFWKTFAIILIVVIVVGAVIVFWRNPELSPNGGIIKVAESKRGTEVYTKAEVDNKFQEITTLAFDNCEQVKWDSGVDGSISVENNNCKYICNKKMPSSICAFGAGIGLFGYPSKAPTMHLFGCTQSTSPVNVNLACLCCS